MNLKIILLIYIFIQSVFFADLTYSQNTEPITIPQLIPPSPNATALAQYADIEVSKYSGIPDITIPIYSIDTDGFQLPINLSYHASGIKVSQEASSAGLGWVLNAGGIITRQVRGIEDFANSPGVKVGFLHSADLPEYQNYDGIPSVYGEDPYSTILDPFINIRYSSMPTVADIVLSREGWSLFSDGFNGWINVDYVADTESDLYSFNFGGFTGKFVLNKDGSTVLYSPQSGLKIDLKSGNSWEVTDSNGIKYLFSEKEHTTPYTYSKGHYEEDLLYLFGANIPGTSYISSWYLSQITLPNDQIINFKYNKLETKTWSFGPIITNRAEPIPGRQLCSYDNNTYNTYNTQYIKSSSLNTWQVYLKSIIWKNGSVNFSYLERDDLFYEREQPLKLNEISIENMTKEISKVKFNMSYFNNQDINDSRKYFSLRLKLDSLSVDDKVYEFQYDTPNGLPKKYSVSYDHWGYYNAKNNLSDNSYFDQIHQKWVHEPYFIAELMVTDYSHFSKDSLYSGANRECNPTVITNGVLTSIKYPTKGLVNFEFEPNEFSLILHPLNTSYGLLKYEDKYEDISYDVISYAEATNSCQNCGYENNLAEFIEITETSKVKVEFEYHPYGSIQNPSVPIDPTGNGLIFGHLNRIDGEGNFSKSYRFIPGELAHTYTEEIVLFPGTYIIGLSSGHQNFTASGSVQLSIIKELDYSKELIGGGLRIKKIISDKSTREFIYNKEENEGLTSGRLMVEPYYSFFNYGMFQCGPAFMRNSNAIYPLSESISGATVGYSCVREIISDGNDNSIKLSKFINRGQPQIRGGNLPIIIQFENGLLTEETFLNNDKVISRNIYEYKEPLDIQYPDTYFMRINFTVDGRNYYGIHYYELVPEWWKLESKSTFNYFYDSAGNKKETSTTTDYQYNSSNYQINQTKEINSEGSNIKTKIFYPNDVTSKSSLSGGSLSVVEYNAIDRLKAIQENGTFGLNQTTLPIQTEFYENNILLSTQRVTYKTSGGMVLPYKLLSSKGNNPLEPHIEYLTYDNYGNPTELKSVKGPVISFFWGYNGQYPIAKVENATYSEIASALSTTSTILKGYDESNIAAINTLRSNLPKASVTTYTYEPLVGLRTVTNPRGLSMSYEYDSFNRLEFIKDETDQLLKQFKYHYKN